MRKHIATLLVGAVVAATAWADKVELANGQLLTGQVVGYFNMTFELRSADGAVTRLPQAQIKRITFDAVTGVLDTRNQGQIQGRITGFENATFTIQPAQGAAAAVPSMHVKEANFGAGGSGGGEKIKKINSAGSRVDIATHLVAGKVTIVDFYADWCGPCRAIAPTLEKLAASDPDVYLRKVDIKQWGSPVAKQYEIRSIPRVEVYSRSGQLIGNSSSSPQRLKSLVQQAKEAK